MLIFMKHFALFILFIASHLIASAQNSCSFSDNGSANSYTLNSGDVLCIEAGVFTGTILNLDYNAEIRVANGAVFQPSMMLNVNGLISNKGTVKLMSSNTIGSGFSINNDSGALFQFNVAQIFTDAIAINNHKDAQMDFYTAFDLNNGTTVFNEGVMKMKGAMHIQEGSLLTNEGVIYLTNHLTVSGILFNSGIMKVVGSTTIQNTAFFTNKCSYYGKNTFVNNSPQTENYGYINIYGWDTANCKFINNALFYNGDNGIIQSNDFDNYSNITGTGSFTVQQVSRNFGHFGLDGGGINFYDMSPTGNQIFDVQQVIPDNSVSKIAVNLYETMYISGNCNQMIFPDFLNAPLPVVMTVFETTAPNCIPNIYWKTEEEKNSDYFDIERKSESDYGFKSIARLQASGVSTITHEYNYLDENLPNGKYQYRLKIVDLDGKYNYSRVSYLQVFCGNQEETNVFPNPATDVVNVALQTNADDTYHIAIYDLAGRLVYKNEYSFANGFNQVQIPISQFQNGYYSLLITNNIKTESFKLLKN